MSNQTTNPDAAWQHAEYGIEVYADSGEDAGTVCIAFPSYLHLSPRDALAFSRAIAAAAEVAETRRTL